MFKTKLFLFLILSLIIPNNSAKAEEIRQIIFPVIGAVSYTNDFGNIRDGGTRSHEGNDLFGKKMQPLVAAVDGTITFTPYPQPSYGYMVSIRDADGYKYNYIHLNNDTPGTDNGAGDGINAYGVDILDGNPVVKGQLIGYMGDSGNAETTPPHLHFEIRRPDGIPINAYESLRAATKITAPAPYPVLPDEVLPYGPSFTSGANIAAGKFNSDTSADFVTAPRTKGGPHIRVYNSNNTIISEFMAYDPKFIGGVDVATGDVDGDGIDEIITAPGLGGGPHIRVFKTTGVEVASFMAYDPNFRGGLRVSSADVDGDGKAEIIAAPMKGGGPHVKIFKPDGLVFYQFMAYDPKFMGGLDVAGVSKTSGQQPRIVTSPGPTGGPHVKIFEPNGFEIAGFMAYDSNFKGGVKVSTGNVKTNSSEPEVVTVPYTDGTPFVRAFSLSGQFLDDSFDFEPWWIDGYDIAGANGKYFLSSGSGFQNHVRRTSVRDYNLGN
jgi:hypothetical protein